MIKRMGAGDASDQNEVIRLGAAMPRFLRWGLMAVGLFACVMVVKELGPGLWPPSILSLFFGIIVFGGLSVGLSFVVFGGLVPDETWEVRPGRITLTLTRGEHRLQRHFTPADFERLEIVRDSSGDGPDTWHLLGQLKSDSPNRIVSPEREPVLVATGWLKALNAPWSFLRPWPSLEDRMRSPALTTETAAQRALDHFRA